jgi:Holliday junction resolvasome RuvABC endonuclease subunit
MIAIGLDPSLRSFGWAVIDTSSKGLQRRIASGHCVTVSSDCQPARYLHLQQLVRNVIQKFPQTEIVGIESPAYSAGPFQTIHHSLMMFSLAEVFLARKNCVLFDPATREYLIRNGRKGKIGKLDIQRYVQLDTLDSTLIQNDEADAYVIGLFAARLTELRRGIIKPSDLTPAETQKFLLMTRRKKTLKGIKINKTAHIFRSNSRFYDFSQVPINSMALPQKDSISPNLLAFIDKMEL